MTDKPKRPDDLLDLEIGRRKSEVTKYPCLRPSAGRIKRLPACPLGSQPSQTVDIGERRDDRLAEATAYHQTRCSFTHAKD
jgi:hypothetical protein